jgi:hypothetical protein
VPVGWHVPLLKFGPLRGPARVIGGRQPCARFNANHGLDVWPIAAIAPPVTSLFCAPGRVVPEGLHPWTPSMRVISSILSCHSSGDRIADALDMLKLLFNGSSI